jgi:hypothetical protein
MARTMLPAPRRLATAIIAISATVLLLAAFFASPLILLLIDKTLHVDWTHLSEISQTYDAASALLAGIAVGGVAASLAIQVRQVRISQIQAARLMHLDLMKMLTADPVLRSTSPTAIGVTEEQWRRSIYTNLFFKYLEMGFTIGHISEESLRLHFSIQFKLGHVREFWARNRETYRTDADRRGPQRFFAIVDQQYTMALDREGPQWIVDQPPGDRHEEVSASQASHGTRRRGEVLGSIAGFVVGSILTGAMTRRRARRANSPDPDRTGRIGARDR